MKKKSETKEKRPYQNFWGNHKIGSGTKIAAFVEIGDNVVIGKNCSIQAFVFICPLVTIEDDVFIGPHVCFTNDKKPPSFGKYWEKTLVKKGAVIGANSTIIPGVTIGNNAIVGAGSVVTKNIGDGEKWYGQAAKKHSV
jgi:acetyltransferase-like isoleucine patch superfamily enzyme